MNKPTLLKVLEEVRKDAELKEIDNAVALQTLSLLIDYINDADIQKAVNNIPM